MWSILDAQLSPAEWERLVHAKKGFHFFYVALAVEYVAKYSTSASGITEAVL